jgi:beta-hydroxylase
MSTVESPQHVAIQTSSVPAVVTAPELDEPEIQRILPSGARRRFKRIMKRALGLSALMGVGLACGIMGYSIVPIVLVFYFVCGLLDVMRNTRRDIFTIDNYFFGNGVCTWLLSPFNLLMDVLALPYVNKGLYQLEDLPAPIQEEINDLIKSSHDCEVTEQLESRIGSGRSMIFFKWYGKNLKNSIEIPAFHKRYRYIRTIGVSVFNKRKSTSWHYGPLRATFRVLYNLRPSSEDAAFIQVGRYTHRWNKGPLFIFDDTLMHRSCNETDAVRYCMFIDIVRPSCCPPLVRGIVTGLQYFLVRVRFVFYNRWAEIH